MALITFHRIIRGCEEGRPEAWRQFLAQYSPAASQLASVYLPSLASGWNQFWQNLVRSLAAEDCRQLRGFDHQGEREFLLALRAFLLERGEQEIDSSKDLSGAPEPTPGRVAGLLNGLPLMHQSILFLKLAGYSDGTIEKVFTITPAIAQQGLERLRPEY